MVLDSWRKKIEKKLRKKPEEGMPIPENWAEELEKQETTSRDEDGTIRVIYEPKKTKRYIARRIKRFICFSLIIANFIMLVTCFFVQGGIMAPFFFLNTVFLADYFWQSRPNPLEQFK